MTCLPMLADNRTAASPRTCHNRSQARARQRQRQSMQHPAPRLQAQPQRWTGAVAPPFPGSWSLFATLAACVQWPARKMQAEYTHVNLLARGFTLCQSRACKLKPKRRAVALTMRKAMMGRTCRAFSITKGSLVNSDMSCPCTRHARMRPCH